MKNDNRKLHILPNSIGLLILELIVLVADIVFLSLLAVLDILPMAANISVFVIIILLTALIFKLLNSRKEGTKQRKTGAVISVLLILLLGVGCFYLFTTYEVFHNMSDEDKQYESFYVVALKHGDYKKLSDIEGKTVFTYESPSSSYKEAQETLKKETGVSYKEVGGFMKLQTTLIDGKKNEHDRIIFLSSSNYDMICEYTKGFEENTRIIHQVTVDIQNKDLAKRVGITEEPFNVYISGIDTYGGIGKVSRSDVNMIMTVNPQNKQILLTSIPRDTYVKLHSYGQLDKLTHSGIYGIDETVSTVEDWLNLDINYYIRVNFTSLQDIVDAIGGIDVTSPHAFKSSVSEYSYTEGVNHLDGEAALFFARERKSFSDGDQERIKNQQRVLSAILEKVTGSSVILTKYTQLLNAVGDEIQTNLAQKDISSLVRTQLSDLGDWNIESISITGKGTYDSTYSMGSRQLYVVVPDDASVEAAQEKIEANMGSK
ncbi:LCP family protein [Anaerovorax odorimutans]|uniref:LCP family protein n=1 Tax=Anaerovorax odorimutans TaxID=109327 RepID=A0ABT1RPW7_9FIRM|nr:LCP family protein [Anaerovorax odorimutans]MCQ4637208.1 LCP family protein [Anaerovorax odorimutans]